MRECYSGDIFVTAFYRQNEESFLEGIVNGLEHFGGTPQKIIFDNARVAVCLRICMLSVWQSYYVRDSFTAERA